MVKKSELIQFNKWVYVILCIYNKTDLVNSISTISKKTDITYPHTSKIIKILKQKNIVTLEPAGRIIEVTLTKNGLKVAEHLSGIFEKLKIPHGER